MSSALVGTGESFGKVSWKGFASTRFLVLALLIVGMTTTVSAEGSPVRDGFEDGDYSNNPTWSDVSGSSYVNVVSSGCIEGSYCVEIDAASSSSNDNVIRYTRSSPTLKDGDTYKFYVKNTGSSIFSTYYTITDSKDPNGQNTENAVVFQLQNSGSNPNDFGIRTYDGNSDQISDTSFGSYQADNWYEVSLTFDKVNSEVDAEVIDVSDGSVDGTASVPYDSDLSGSYVQMNGRADVAYFDLATYEIQYNQAPQFNSSSVSPDPPLIGENVSYSAEVFDSDGSIDYTNLSLSYGGSQVVSDEKRTGNTPEWNDIYKPQSGNKWLNATLETVDDKGAVTTKEIDRYLSDTAPQINLDKPGNTSYFKYSVPVEFSVPNSDSLPDEEVACDLSLDGSLFREVNVTEGSSYSSSFDADLGQHDLNVSCTDPAGNTNSTRESFTVKALEEVSVSGDSPVYSTLNKEFDLDLKTGEMVNSVDFKLYYSGTSEDKTGLVSNGVEILQPTLNHDIPLVSSNQTVKNWKINYEANISDIDTGYETEKRNTSKQNQEVWHVYEFKSHDAENGFTQVEGSVVDYTAEVQENNADAKGVLTGETTYNQTGTSKNLDKNGLSFSESFATDLVNTSQLFGFETVFTVDFNGDTRSFSSTQAFNLDNLELGTGSGQETLVLSLRDEVSDNLTAGNIEAGLKVSHPDQPGKKQFFGFDLTGQDSYSIKIQPSYAEVDMEAFETTSLEYQNSDDNYPKRRYYFLDEVLNNQSITTDLYMLKDSEGQEVQFSLKDSDLNPLPNHLIRIERVFPDQEDTKTVAQIKTGSQGKGSTFLDTDERYIYTIFDSEGELVQQIGPQTITENPTELELSEETAPSFANLVQQVRFSDVTETNDSLTVEYVSDTERLNNITLSVYEETLFGKKKIAEDYSTDLQGILQVSGYNSSEERVFYDLQGTFGDSELSLRTGSFGEIKGEYGQGGIFVSLMTFLVLTFAGVFRPSATIGMGLVAIVAMAFTGLMPLTQTALISVISLGAVMIWRMSTKA